VCSRCQFMLDVCRFELWSVTRREPMRRTRELMCQMIEVRTPTGCVCRTTHRRTPVYGWTTGCWPCAQALTVWITSLRWLMLCVTCPSRSNTMVCPT
jgi:hypothetical protein